MVPEDLKCLLEKTLKFITAHIFKKGTHAFDIVSEHIFKLYFWGSMFGLPCILGRVMYYIALIGKHGSARSYVKQFKEFICLLEVTAVCLLRSNCIAFHS